MKGSAVAYDYSRAGALDWSAAEALVFDGETSAGRCRRMAYVIVKRAIDIPLAALLLLLTLPVFVIVAAVVRASSPGPVFFRQTRLGRNGRPFECLKFRSMRMDAELVLRRDPQIFARYVANGYKLPEGEDPRITRIGRLLRKSSLDELPQLINVLRGEMSLVGPRPIVPAEIAEYGTRGDDLLAAFPGITGRWQVGGRSKVTYPKRARIELDYVYNWSLLEDLRILLRTVPAVLRREGAH